MNTMPALRHGADSYAHADPRHLDLLGFAWAGQYVLGSHDKQLTAVVAQALIHGGKDILVNAEDTATDADGGFQQGVNFATVANQQADVAGVPVKNFDGSPIDIYYSVDEDRSADQVRPYYQGLNSVRGRSVSGYGGTEIRQMKREKLCRRWWQANAGSWSGWGNPPGSNFPTDPEADIRQYLSTVHQGYAYDPNDQMSADCGLWLSPLNQSPAPNQGGSLSAQDVTDLEAHLDATVRDAEANIDKTVQDTRTDILAAFGALKASFDAYVAAHP